MEFIASNPEEEGHHPYWQSQVQVCAPCHVNYDRIVTLENLKNEGFEVSANEM